MSVQGCIQKGHKLFTEGNVDLVFEDESMLQFHVKSNKKEYLISINNNGLRCNECKDWTYRWKPSVNNGGSFLCSHCYAAIFKLAELQEANNQAIPEITKIREVS